MIDSRRLLFREVLEQLDKLRRGWPEAEEMKRIAMAQWTSLKLCALSIDRAFETIDKRPFDRALKEYEETGRRLAARLPKEVAYESNEDDPSSW